MFDLYRYEQKGQLSLKVHEWKLSTTTTNICEHFYKAHLAAWVAAQLAPISLRTLLNKSPHIVSGFAAPTLLWLRDRRGRR